MNIDSCRTIAAAAIVACGLAAPSLWAEPMSELSLTPRNAGPVQVSDIQVLLGRNLLFQLFDFEPPEAFCLHFIIVHQSNGKLVERQEAGGFCNLAGRNRVVVKMEPVGRRQQLTFAVHTESGMGGSIGSGLLEVGSGDHWGMSLYPGEGIVRLGTETHLLTWKLTDFDEGHREYRIKHEIRIDVRLTDNPGNSIGTANWP